MVLFSADVLPKEYFCAEVSEMYGPRGKHFSSASCTTVLVAFIEEDGTTLLNSPLGSGRQTFHRHHSYAVSR